MLNRYIRENQEKIVKIPVEDILLVDEKHKEGVLKEDTAKKSAENLCVILNSSDNGKYNLVVGWNDYMVAKQKGLSEVNAIIVKESRAVFIRKHLSAKAKRRIIRKRLLPYKMQIESLDNASVFPLNAIIVTNKYRATSPKEEKIKMRIDYFNEHGRLPQAVRINSRDELCDGYATYVAAQHLGLRYVPVVLVK